MSLSQRMLPTGVEMSEPFPQTQLNPWGSARSTSYAGAKEPVGSGRQGFLAPRQVHRRGPPPIFGGSRVGILETWLGAARGLTSSSRELSA